MYNNCSKNRLSLEEFVVSPIIDNFKDNFIEVYYNYPITMIQLT